MAALDPRNVVAWPRRVYRHLTHDRLYRNSLILMVNTATLAGFGFVFWATAARLYSSTDVGLVTALVSAGALIMTLSTLGFDNTFMRFLARSDTARAQINTGLTVTGLAALVTALLYVAAVSLFVPRLSFISGSLLWTASFTLFAVANVWNNLTNYVFVAYRIPYVVLSVSLAFGIVRLALVMPLSGAGLTGLSLSYAISIGVALVMTFILLRRFLDYTYRPVIDTEESRKMFGYTSMSYFSSILLMVPMMILPTVLVRVLGPSYSAYYYVVSVVIIAINVIPEAASQSLFAEGSWDEARLRESTRKAFKISAVLLIPCILVMLVFGRLILEIFGQGYARNGYALLVLLAVSTVPRAVSYVYSTMLRVEYRVGAVVRIYALYSVVTLGGSFVGFAFGLGLLSIGYATLLGETCTALLFFSAASRRNARLQV